MDCGSGMGSGQGNGDAVEGCNVVSVTYKVILWRAVLLADCQPPVSCPTTLCNTAGPRPAAWRSNLYVAFFLLLLTCSIFLIQDNFLIYVSASGQYEPFGNSIVQFE